MTTSLQTPASPTAPATGAIAPAEPTPTGARSLTRAAGWAAVVKGLTYVLGLGVMGAYLAPRGFADAQGDPAASLDLLVAHPDAMYSWYLVLYLVGGLALAVLAQGLRARLAGPAPALAATSAVVGYLWAGLLLASGLIALVGQTAVLELAADDRALAVSTWSAVSVIQDALGGGIELVGGVWALLIGWIGLRTRTFGLSFSLNAVLIGLLGVVTLVPGLADVAGVSFGLTFVVWFFWAGVVLLRGAPARR